MNAQRSRCISSPACHLGIDQPDQEIPVDRRSGERPFDATGVKVEITRAQAPSSLQKLQVGRSRLKSRHTVMLDPGRPAKVVRNLVTSFYDRHAIIADVAFLGVLQPIFQAGNYLLVANPPGCCFILGHGQYGS